MNLIGKRKYTYILSAFMIGLSIFSLSYFGLKLGIDFAGGSMMEVSQVTDIERVKVAADSVGIESFEVQPSGEGEYFLRMKEITEDKHEEFKNTLSDAAVEERFESVGPTISKELILKAFWAIGLASIAIVIYVAYAFRKVPKPVTSWQFSFTAILALIHDTSIVIGIFALLGYLFGIEVDSYFVTAILTVIGYSLNDTIVVFDRIREKLIKKGGNAIEGTVNQSVNETIVRSLNTSFTVLIVLAMLYLLGGDSIKNFVLALAIGVAAGTYSSIFFASPILVDWQRWREKRLGHR